MATTNTNQASQQLPWDLSFGWTGKVGQYIASGYPTTPFIIISGENQYTKTVTCGDGGSDIALTFKLLPFSKPDPTDVNVAIEGLSLWVEADTVANDQNRLIPVDTKLSIDNRWASFKNTYFEITNSLTRSNISTCILEDFVVLSSFNRYQDVKVKSNYLGKANKLSISINAKLMISPTSSGKSGSPNQSVNAFEELKAMYAAQDNFPDFKLQSKDNMIISAHKFVLAGRSSYIRGLLQDNKLVDGKGILHIAEIYAKPLNAILHWIYTQEILDSVAGIIPDLLEAAKLLQLNDFPKALDSKLIKFCTTENMFQLVALAKQHGLNIALRDVSRFIKTNIAAFVDL